MKLGQTRKPKVSVVIATYNRASLLSRAVNSVLNQTYKDFEIIIVDDCSTDSTQKVVQSFADTRIRAVQNTRNMGQSRSRNTGIRMAQGEYVAFLDDDDEWVESKIARQVRVLDESDQCVGLVYTWFDYIEAAGGIRRVGGRSTISGDISGNLIGWDMPASPSAYLVRAEALRQVGGFDESLRMAEDRDFLLRVSMQYNVTVVEEVLTLMHKGHGYIGPAHQPFANPHMVKYIKSHLCRFNEELNTRPRSLARILRDLAFAEISLGNRRAAVQSYWKAFRLDPAGSLRTTYNNIGLILRLLWERFRSNNK